MKKDNIFKIALVLVFVLLCSIAIATFIENKFSADLSWELIFNSIWFEIITLLVAILMVFNFIYIAINKKLKIATSLIHFSILLIVIGGVSKKHFGFQGELYLIKDEQSDTIYSKSYYMDLEANKGTQKVKYSIKGSNSFDHKFSLFGDSFDIKNKFYYQHIKQNIIEDKENGFAVIDFEVISDDGRKSFIFEEFGRLKLEKLEINFNKEPRDLTKPYIKIISNQHQMIHFISNINIKSNFDESYERNKIHKFHSGILYQVGDVKLLADEITTLGRVQTESDETKKGKSALFSLLTYKGKQTELVLNEDGKHYSSYKKSLSLNDVDIRLDWAKKKIKLPFILKLNNFNIKRYFGSNIISSYESNLSLIDLEGKKISTNDIKVNEPLRYDGYSIFQTTSSMYGGTVFQVNYNPTIWIIYFGYLFLTLGLIINIFSKDSYFLRLKKSL